MIQLTSWDDVSRFVREGHSTDSLVDVISLFNELASQDGDRSALTALSSADPFGAVLEWSRSRLAKDVRATAIYLESLGLKSDDSIGLLLPTIPEMHLFLWGGMAVCSVAPINPLLRYEHILHLALSMQLKVIVCPSKAFNRGLWDIAHDLAAEIPKLKIVEAGPASDFQSQIEQASHTQRTILPRPVNARAGLFHTGGTTGNPKIAPLTILNILASVDMLQVALNFSSQDTFVCPLPLFHIAGAVVGGLAPLLAGTQVVMPAPTGLRDPEVITKFWQLLEHFRATMLVAVPTSIAALLTVPLKGADLSSLDYTLTGTAPLPFEVARRYTEVTGKVLHTGYGMTECAGALAYVPRRASPRPSTVGLPLSGVEIKIVPLGLPTSDESVPVGTAGRVFIRGTNVFSGYLHEFRDQKKTGLKLWFDTGDLGWLGEDGYLTLTGRSKDLIIRSGHNIDPSVIEESAQRIDGVLLVAAIGQIDAYAGEVPVLYVQPCPGVDKAELLAILRRQLEINIAEPPARPREVFVIDQMPLTAVGKIFKPTLRIDAARRKLEKIIQKFPEGNESYELSVEIDSGGKLNARVKLNVMISVGREQTIRQELEKFPIHVDVCAS